MNSSEGSTGERRITPPTAEHAPEAIQVASIDALRDKQRANLWARVQASVQEGAVEDTRADASYIDEAVKDHLIASGVAEDDPVFAEQFVFLRDRSIDKIGIEWEAGETDELGNHKPSQRMQTYATLNTTYATSPKPPVRSREDEAYSYPDEDEANRVAYHELGRQKEQEEYVVDVEAAHELAREEERVRLEAEYAQASADVYDEAKRRNEELDTDKARKDSIVDLRMQVESMRNDRNVAYAKRMRAGVINRKKRARLDEEFRATDDVYSNNVFELLKVEITDMAAAGATPDQIRDFVVTSTLDRFDDDSQAKRTEMVKLGGAWGNVLKNYAEASFKKKLVISGIAGVALGLGGGLAALGLGAIGSVAATAGAGAFASLRAGRAYAVGSSRIYKEGNLTRAKKVTKLEAADIAGADFGQDADARSAAQQATDFLRARTHEEIISAEKSKWITIASAIGAVAAGSLVTHAAHAADRFGASRKVGEELGNAKNFLQAKGRDIAGIAKVPEVPKVPTPDAGTSKIDISTPLTEAEMKAMPQLKDALHITKGEGWYNTFKEMGVKPADRAELLRHAGPDLVKAGYAYPDAKIGGYGMLMTNDHELPAGAVEILARTAHEQGIHSSIVDKLNLGGVSTAPEVAVPRAAVIPEQAPLVRPEVSGNDFYDFGTPASGLTAADIVTPNGRFAAESLVSGKLTDADAKDMYALLATNPGLDKDAWQPLLDKTARALSDVRSSAVDGSLAYKDSAGNWQFRTVDGKIPLRTLTELRRQAGDMASRIKIPQSFVDRAA